MPGNARITPGKVVCHVTNQRANKQLPFFENAAWVKKIARRLKRESKQKPILKPIRRSCKS